MKKFLIVDTFNGSGYSDSNAKIKEFLTVEDAKNYAISVACEYTDDIDSIVILDNLIQYDVDGGDDNGAVHFAPLMPLTVAVLIYPMTNEFVQLNKSGEAKTIANLLLSDESQDGEDLEATCHHLDDSVEIYFKIDSL